MVILDLEVLDTIVKKIHDNEIRSFRNNDPIELFFLHFEVIENSQEGSLVKSRNSREGSFAEADELPGEIVRNCCELPGETVRELPGGIRF